jgi:hypothetical protein
MLAAEGLGDWRPTRITITPDDAKAVASDDQRVVPASIARDRDPPPEAPHNPHGALAEALVAARSRGAAVKEASLAGPDMLNTAAIADLLGMSEEGVRLKRKRHEILGLEFAKRGIRYPAWQVLEGRQLLPALPRLFAMLGDDPFRLFRFLQQHHSELGGARALDALRQGRIEGVLAAAENIATGAAVVHTHLAGTAIYHVHQSSLTSGPLQLGHTRRCRGVGYYRRLVAARQSQPDVGGGGSRKGVAEDEEIQAADPRVIELCDAAMRNRSVEHQRHQSIVDVPARERNPLAARTDELARKLPKTIA